MKLQLPNNITTPQDLSMLLLEVRTYAKWFSHNSIKHTVNAKSGSPAPALSPSTIEVIKQWTNSELMNQKHLDKLIDALETFQKNASLVTITLAASPGGDTKHALTDWCRSNLGTDLLISFRFNSTILGGMVVRLGSHVFDWSFRRILLDKKDAFPEVLRRV